MSVVTFWVCAAMALPLRRRAWSRLTSDLSLPVAGQHVLLVEDIVDTGLTLRYLLDLLQAQGRPAFTSARSSASRPGVESTYRSTSWASKFPIRFVVGYGLDADQKYRSLPYVALVDE